MKTYKGSNTGAGGQTILIGKNGKERRLPHVSRHSPNGFQWGYGGSGPADTALSYMTAVVRK